MTRILKSKTFPIAGLMTPKVTAGDLWETITIISWCHVVVGMAFLFVTRTWGKWADVKTLGDAREEDGFGLLISRVLKEKGLLLLLKQPVCCLGHNSGHLWFGEAHETQTKKKRK